jgi:hypothetical protein
LPQEVIKGDYGVLVKIYSKKEEIDDKSSLE